MTEPLTLLTLEALMLSWPDGLAVDRETGHGSCIETTLLVSKVLGRLGIDHKPMPCQVWFANAKAVELADAGITVDQWPPDAFSIGLDPDTPVRQASISEPYTLGTFGGHLAVAGHDWILDLTAEQFHRPDKGIIAQGGLLADDLPFDPIARDVRRMFQANLRGGGLCRYIPRMELASWRRTPAWRQDIPTEILDTICQAVLTKLAERAG